MSSEKSCTPEISFSCPSGVFRGCFSWKGCTFRASGLFFNRVSFLRVGLAEQPYQSNKDRTSCLRDRS